MDIQQLESVQRSFTSRISGVQHLDYWNRLRALNLMSLQRRRERYIILHVWKILRGITPNDLDFQFSNASRHGIKAIVPALLKTSSARNQTLYDASFRVMGARLWNIIPASLHYILDPLQFKVKLTAFFKTFPDKYSIDPHLFKTELVRDARAKPCQYRMFPGKLLTVIVGDFGIK